MSLEAGFGSCQASEKTWVLSYRLPASGEQNKLSGTAKARLQQDTIMFRCGQAGFMWNWSPVLGTDRAHS